MIDEFEADLCHLMAVDELKAYENLSAAEDFEAFFAAFNKRRELLNEIDRYRILTLANQPNEISAVFKRLNLPLDLPSN